MLSTFLTERWGLSVPLIGAPMSPQAGGQLAAAVSNCGALGMIGVASTQPVERLLEDVEEVRGKARGRPFGIGLMVWAVKSRPELLDVALQAKPFAIAMSFGDPSGYADRIRCVGAKLLCQVQDGPTAELAEAAGADVLVAQGTEAGGHTGTLGTLPLLQRILEGTRLPVVAAGGIATGRGLAAVLAAGAQGAWIGTPLLVAEEARNSPLAKKRLLDAGDEETILTSIFDIAQGIPWPKQFRGRALRNHFTERWSGHEIALETDAAARRSLDAAKKAEDYSTAFLYAGQSVGLLSRIEPAATILRRIASDAEAQVRALAHVVTHP